MRVAVFNVENLFDRAKVMNLETWEQGRDVLERFAELSQLLGDVLYTPTMKRRMIELMQELGLEKSDKSKYVILRRNRGKLLRRPRAGGLEIVAEGRVDWAGSLELIDEPIDEDAMRNTARVIRDLKADVLGIVEAEDRPGLVAFNRSILGSPQIKGELFSHIMLIDGNDDRGIDVGLMTKTGYPIGHVRSHVDDKVNGRPIFSRDCPEYTVRTPGGQELIVMVNHLKSKGYGKPSDNNRRRQQQAERIAEIYNELRTSGEKLVLVMGDLNDTPDSKPLAPLLKNTDLKDAFLHKAFDDGGYPGTHNLCNSKDKIDYLLLSPELFERVTAGGVIRTGMWPGVRPRRWEVYDELKRMQDAASDHAAIWAEIDL